MPPEEFPLEVLHQMATLAGISLDADRLKEIARRLALLQDNLRQLRAVPLGDTAPMPSFKR
jgi:hypothetical protein